MRGGQKFRRSTGAKASEGGRTELLSRKQLGRKWCGIGKKFEGCSAPRLGEIQSSTRCRPSLSWGRQSRRRVKKRSRKDVHEKEKKVEERENNRKLSQGKEKRLSVSEVIALPFPCFSFVLEREEF